MQQAATSLICLWPWSHPIIACVFQCSQHLREETGVMSWRGKLTTEVNCFRRTQQNIWVI